MIWIGTNNDAVYPTKIREDQSVGGKAERNRLSWAQIAYANCVIAESDS